MTREQLEHAIRAACDIIGDDEVYVFGSQAILGTYPDAPAVLLRSIEVDISPRKRVERAEAINSIGEESMFHRTFGFYVHGIPITESATLPRGWQQRTICISNANTNGRKGHCLDGHDLAASKLVAHRDKDRDFVRELLGERMISSRKLVSRIRLLPVEAKQRERLVQWVHVTVRDLAE